MIAEVVLDITALVCTLMIAEVALDFTALVCTLMIAEVVLDIAAMVCTLMIAEVFTLTLTGSDLAVGFWCTSSVPAAARHKSVSLCICCIGPHTIVAMESFEVSHCCNGVIEVYKSAAQGPTIVVLELLSAPIP